MKYFSRIFTLVFCIAVALACVACGKDKVCGTWHLTYISYVIDGRQHAYTIAEAKEIPVDRSQVDSWTKEDYAKDIIKDFAMSFGDADIIFQEDNVLKFKREDLDLLEYTWERKDEYVIYYQPGSPIRYIFAIDEDDNSMYCYLTYDEDYDVIIYVER